jgi:hypothetical protein
MPRTLHIVSFDVPYPPNYGGVIDVYYKLLWLKRQGVSVILHCYAYGREPAPELEELCERIHYYGRKTGWRSALSFIPYNVLSRRSAELVDNLLGDDHPVLFEVLHTCEPLVDPRLKGKLKIYRHSNVEHRYYRELAGSEKNFLKKIYLYIESVRLHRFEKVLKGSDMILSVNRSDTDYFKKKYPSVRTEYLPSFHASGSVNVQEGRGEYVLFQGNLSVSENYMAAVWLIDNIFSQITSRVIIAGLNPPSFLIRKIAKHKHLVLVANPGEEEMSSLIHHAQVHTLYTSQPTGLKLKLLNVLHNGRFIVCNDFMVSGTGLGSHDSFVIANDRRGYLEAVKALMQRSFSNDLVQEREEALRDFSNEKNAALLTRLIFGESGSDENEGYA